MSPTLRRMGWCSSNRLNGATRTTIARRMKLMYMYQAHNEGNEDSNDATTMRSESPLLPARITALKPAMSWEVVPRGWWIVELALDMRDVFPELEYLPWRCNRVHADDCDYRELCTPQHPFLRHTQQLVNVELVPRGSEVKCYFFQLGTQYSLVRILVGIYGENKWEFVGKQRISQSEWRGPGKMYCVIESRRHLEVSNWSTNRNNRFVPACFLAPSRFHSPRT